MDKIVAVTQFRDNIYIFTERGIIYQMEFGYHVDNLKFTIQKVYEFKFS